jgi:cytochrome c oxidase assembly protein subunit 15
MALATEITTGRVAHRLALAAALCAVPLVVFGGSVTSLGAGMAVDGWLVAEGHFLLFFPLESWLRDTGTFVEHTHRLFGVLVGLFALGACAAAWIRCRALGRAVPIVATLALLAVSAQGVVGGLRVLENSRELAFLHGALAQAVFALLCASALLASPRWRAARPTAVASTVHGGGAALRSLSVATVVVVYAQIVLGAWYRHGLRAEPWADASLRFLAHAAGALAVLVAVTFAAALAARAARGAEGGSSARAVLARSSRRLRALVAAQILLGLLAWLAFRPDAVGPFEWTLSVLHVLCGGLLLAETTALSLWAWRTLSPASRGVVGSTRSVEAMR